MLLIKIYPTCLRKGSSGRPNCAQCAEASTARWCYVLYGKFSAPDRQLSGLCVDFVAKSVPGWQTNIL
jgi:hypothetical protein